MSDNEPAILGRDKRGAIILVADIEPGIDTELAKDIAHVLKQGGTIETTTTSGVRAALDRDGWNKPTGEKAPPKQAKLFND